MKSIKSQNQHLIDGEQFLAMISNSARNWQAHGKQLGLDPSWIISEYVAWISAWLFLRWVEHEDAEREAIATFNGEDYLPLIPNWLKWESCKKIEPHNFGSFLESKVVPYLENLDNRSLAIHLKRIAKFLKPSWFGYSEPFEARRRSIMHDTLCEILTPLDFCIPEHVESASSFLDSILYSSIQKARSAEFYTPKAIVDLMVELADPQLGESIYDPCFGTGGLLVQSARKIREAAVTSTAGEWERMRCQSIFGVEWNPTAYTIAVTRIVLAGIPEPGLEIANSLMRPRGESSFDVVLACPPWGHIDNEIRESLRSSYNVAARDWSNVFVQHAMQSLKPGGRAVIALPESILFGIGPDRQLREWLLRDFKVDGIISLPEGSFAPYTGIKSSLAVFRREKPAESVYFYHTQKLAGTAVKVAAKEEKAFDIAKRFMNREIGPYSWVTSIEDLAKRNWELVAKKTGDEQLNKWLDKICTPITEVQKLELKEVAIVVTGIKYDRKRATEKKNNKDDIPLVRITDINEGLIGKPSLYMSRSDIRFSDQESIIEFHDLLISKTGTIGKVALVRPEDTINPKDTTNQLIASQSLVIIRPYVRILPEYLYALLRSTSYQQWMEGHARGAKIQHLSIEALKHLPLPVPDIHIQDRVVKELKQRQNTDVMAVLADIVLKKEDKKTVESGDEINVATLVANLPLTVTSTNSIERVKQAAGVYLLLLEILSDTDFLSHWYNYTEKAIKLLTSVDKYPKSSALYSILNNALISVEYFNEYICTMWPLDSQEEVSSLVEKINSFLINELQNAITEIKGTALIIASICDNLVTIGSDNEIEINLQNTGFLPLIDVDIEIEPQLGKLSIGYMAENSNQAASVIIPKQYKIGKFDFELNWKAKHIDGSDADGVIGLAVEIQSIRDVAHVSDLGASPYVTGSPIEAERPEMFFGRKKIIENIRRQLSTSHRANIILLEGNRRSGKTSILNHLSRPEVLPGWIPVYCSFQGGTGDTKRAGLPTHGIFKLLAKKIFEDVLEAGERTWFPDLPMPALTGLKFKVEFAKTANQLLCDENAFELFELYLQSVLRTIAPKKLLLMLDEFDKIQEGIDTGVTSPQIPENIRYLLHTYPETSAVLSYSKILRRLRNEYWSMLFGLGHRVTVGSLPEEDARLLVTKPAENKLLFADTARDKIVSLCAQQPFIIQQLCNRIFDIASETGQRTITESVVDQAAHYLAVENEHFRTLWDHHMGSAQAGPERRRLVLILCKSLENGPDSVTFDLLEKKLVGARIFAKNLPQLLKGDLDHLVDLDLLTRQENGSRYFLTLPLMASWIERNIDFEGQIRLAQKECEDIST